MRFAGALALLVVLVAVAETRPSSNSRDKRGIKICSARDVKFMATFVCNLHKRSVRSVDANVAPFALPGADDDEMGVLSPAGYFPRRPPCGDDGKDCEEQIDAPALTDSSSSSSHMNYLQALLSENGYFPAAIDERNLARIIENEKLLNLITENGVQREDLRMMMDRLSPHLKGAVAKRNREINWPMVSTMTLGDIRKACCMRQCRVEDFYGACS